MKDFVIEAETQEAIDAAQKALTDALQGTAYLIAPAIFYIDYSEKPTFKIGDNGLPVQDRAGIISAQGFRLPLRILDDAQVPTAWPKDIAVRTARDDDVRFG